MKTHHYKTVLSQLAILLFILGLSIQARPTYAQTPAATPTVIPSATVVVTASAVLSPTTVTPVNQNPVPMAEPTFAQFNQPDITLLSPIDQYSFNFEVPYRWIIKGNDTYLELRYDMRYSTAAPPTSTATGASSTSLSVYLDDTLLASFHPVEGVNQVIRLPIPPAAVSTPNPGGYQLQFVYISGDCEVNQEKSDLVIHNASFIHFKYDLSPLELNLANFPRPLVQNLFGPESILIVIPDQYREADLTAAASVAATMAHRTFGKVGVELVTAAEATPERLAHNSAIIIGRPSDNAFILDLYQRNRLPTTLTKDQTLIVGPANQSVSPDDGVLQEVLSDFSPDHVYLIVTGANDAAITQAAQALSVVSPRYGLAGNLTVITEFHQIVSEAAQPADTLTLADLGFKDTTFYGVGPHNATLRLFIPANWRLGQNPTLTLRYVNSNSLSKTSSLATHLNNNLVGSAPIDSMILGEQQAVIQLPATDFKPGSRNRLNFEVHLDLELPKCQLPKLESAWLRLMGTSQVSIPHSEEDTSIPASLNDALGPFVLTQDLSDTWLSLPQTPTSDELQGMVRVAWWLGNFSEGPSFRPRVSLGTVSDTTLLNPYHVIAFGRPTGNPLIQLLDEKLPQPFMPGGDNLRQEVGNVVYRLPDNFSLGILQALPAPWNPKKVVVVVSGTTSEAVKWAMQTLTDEATYYDLTGDIAYIHDKQIESFKSAKFINGPLITAVQAMTTTDGTKPVLEVAPTATPVALAAVPPAAGSAPVSQRYLPPDASPSALVKQLTYGLIWTGLIIVVIGGFRTWRRTRSH